MISRLSWGLADQALSSATNLVVSTLVVRSLGAAAFGGFALAWVTYGVALNISRGLATDPLTVRFSGAPTDRWRRAVAGSSATALAIGSAGGAVCVLTGLAIHGALGSALLGLGLVLPALTLQDSCRFAFFAVGQGRRAFANDLVWAAAIVPAMLFATRFGSAFAFILAWGAAGGVAAVYGLVQTRAVPNCALVAGWVRRQRDLGPRYMLGNLLESGATSLRMYVLGAIAGLAAVGAVRGAQLLQGPFLALLMGVSLVSVPEAARVLAQSPRHLPLFGALLGAAQAAAALMWGLGLLLLVPDAVGRYLLGPVWDTASPLIIPTMLTVMGIGCCAGASACLRALGASGRSLRAQLQTSVVFVVGGTVGAIAAGAPGSAWGVAIGVGVETLIWWLHLRAGMQERSSIDAATRLSVDPQGAA